MARHGVLLALGVLLILAGTVCAASGWFSSSRPVNPRSCRDAAWHYRNAGPCHWRACLLQH